MLTVSTVDQLESSPPKPPNKRPPRPSKLQVEVLVNPPPRKLPSQPQSAGKIRIPPLSSFTAGSTPTSIPIKSPTASEAPAISPGTICIPLASTIPLTRALLSKTQAQSELPAAGTSSEGGRTKEAHKTTDVGDGKRGGTAEDAGSRTSTRVSLVPAVNSEKAYRV